MPRLTATGFLGGEVGHPNLFGTAMRGFNRPGYGQYRQPISVYAQQLLDAMAAADEGAGIGDVLAAAEGNPLARLMQVLADRGALGDPRTWLGRFTSYPRGRELARRQPPEPRVTPGGDFRLPPDIGGRSQPEPRVTPGGDFRIPPDIGGRRQPEPRVTPGGDLRVPPRTPMREMPHRRTIPPLEGRGGIGTGPDSGSPPGSKTMVPPIGIPPAGRPGPTPLPTGGDRGANIERRRMKLRRLLGSRGAFAGVSRGLR